MNEATGKQLGRKSGRHLGKRLKWFLLSGAGLIGCALAYIEFFYSRPIGKGPAGPNVPVAAFSSTWTERRVEVVGIGDSITAGLGAASPQHTYFARLIANPSNEYAEMVGKCLSAVLTNLRHENLAVSGTTSISYRSTKPSSAMVRIADNRGEPTTIPKIPTTGSMSILRIPMTVAMMPSAGFS